jgi:MFS family permease
MTYGIGMLIGSLLSGVAVDFFTSPTGTHNWKGFWLSSSFAAFLLFLAMAVFFGGHTMIRSKQADPVTDPSLIETTP